MASAKRGRPLGPAAPRRPNARAIIALSVFAAIGLAAIPLMALHHVPVDNVRQHATRIRTKWGKCVFPGSVSELRAVRTTNAQAIFASRVRAAMRHVLIRWVGGANVTAVRVCSYVLRVMRCQQVFVKRLRRWPAPSMLNVLLAIAWVAGVAIRVAWLPPTGMQAASMENGARLGVIIPMYWWEINAGVFWEKRAI